jgi:hypothetical protein
MKRLNFLFELLRQKAVWILGACFAGVSTYDAVSSQLSLPKIGDVVGVSDIPGWVYVVGLLFVGQYALFEATFQLREEVAKRPVARRPRAVPPPVSEPDISLGDVGERIPALQPDATMQDINRAIADRVRLSGLTVWGRIGDTGIQPIPKQELAKATFNFVVNEVIVPTHWNSFKYGDVQMVRSEIDAFWPQH